MPDYSKKSSKKTTKSGAKALQRNDTEDRTIAYRLQRRELGKKSKNGRLRKTCYTTDIDQVEYLFYKNEIYPVAVLELTRYDFDEYDGPNHSWAKYRSSILDRMFIRDAQGKVCQKMAGLLGCGAWIVLFRHDLESYWLFDMMDRQALWVHMDKEEYHEWLVELKAKKLEELEKNNEQS